MEGFQATQERLPDVLRVKPEQSVAHGMVSCHYMGHHSKAFKKSMFDHNTLLAIVLSLGAFVLAFVPDAYAADGIDEFEERTEREQRARDERAERAQHTRDEPARREYGIDEEDVFDNWRQRKRLKRYRSEQSKRGTPPSIGMDIGRFGANEDISSSGMHGTVLVGQIGFGLSKHLSVELRGGFSIDGLTTASDAERFLARELDEVMANPDAYLDLFWGAYVRGNFLQLFPLKIPRLPFEPYLMLGYTRATISAVSKSPTAGDALGTGSILDAVEPDTISYGGGATWTFYNGFSLDIEYMRYLSRDGFSIEGVTLGMNKMWEWGTR